MTALGIAKTSVSEWRFDSLCQPCNCLP